MPYVNIKITREQNTPEQKAALIRGVTQLLVDVLGKRPQDTMVVIDEVDTDNWGIGGESVTFRRHLHVISGMNRLPSFRHASLA
jgi:4-oxalocrotonate tautomerase